MFSRTALLDNFTKTVNIGGGRNGRIIGLKEYVDQRQAVLLADPEVVAQGPIIEGLAASTDAAGDPVYFTATITASSRMLSSSKGSIRSVRKRAPSASVSGTKVSAVATWIRASL